MADKKESMTKEYFEFKLDQFKCELRTKELARGTSPSDMLYLCVGGGCLLGLCIALLFIFSCGGRPTEEKIRSSCEFELEVMKETQALRSRVLSALN